MKFSTAKKGKKIKPAFSAGLHCQQKLVEGR
jgi:hypothetical protein